jgi:hypothetical protein
MDQDRSSYLKLGELMKLPKRKVVEKEKDVTQSPEHWGLEKLVK